jgi:hypothetical protein
MRRAVIGLMALMMVASTVAPAVAAQKGEVRSGGEVRFATFNASLNRFNEGDLLAELQDAVAGSVSDQLAAVLEIISLNDADVLLINEFDFDPAAGALFAELTGYRHHFIAPSNTGVPSGFDLDNSGDVGGPNDAFGFGFFPGQFGMLVLSRYPILERRARTFQNFLWKDMPDALLPVDPATGESWYSDEELDVFRLSSKSHWDVPVRIGRRTVHFLVSHPTPPVFDGAEDRNGTRNSDEIRFWADYVSSRSTSRYIYDDKGRRGGLQPGSFFVVAGDLNSDPFDGDSIPGAAQQLLDHPRVNASVTPSSEGAVEAAAIQGGANETHVGDPRFDTADFADGAPGNLRVDYVLPSKALRIIDAGVFWPVQSDPLFPLVGVFPFPSSDHRMVWVDVRVPGVR